MIIFDDSNAKASKSQDNDFPAEKHYTRSRTHIKPERISRRPRKVSKDVHYTETETSDDDKNQRRKATRPKSKPATEGPSITRIRSQKTRYIHPNRRLPPVPSNGDDTEDRDTEPPTTPSLPIPQRKPSARIKGTKPKVHGVFETKEHTLKKTVTTRKYRCRMCRKGVNSAKELLDHHINKHGIVYCPVCQKAFNNPLSL